MPKEETAQRLPDEITVTMTGEEAYVLILGAIKGNLIYGSSASNYGKITHRLVERFAKEFGINPP